MHDNFLMDKDCLLLYVWCSTYAVDFLLNGRKLVLCGIFFLGK